MRKIICQTQMRNYGRGGMCRIFFLLLLVNLQSCATTGPYTEFSTNSSKAATIHGSTTKRSTFDWDGFQIISVDGKSVDYGFTGNWYDTTIVLDEGVHEIGVKYQCVRSTWYSFGGERRVGYFPVVVNLEAPKKYRVGGKIDGSVAFWIEDMETGRHIMEGFTSAIGICKAM